MDTPSLALGPFLLIEPIGLGGMGEVWRARHPAHDLEVAVKVMTGAHAADPRTQRAFRAEVRSMVRLHHPGITRVFDYGQIPPEAQEASHGRLAAQSPWLVMELANRGSLKQVGPLEHWTDVIPILTSILDPLAHAHARGVIHRDIKPGNVLIVEEDDRLQLKLTDFGIAHAVFEERDQPAPSVAHGTPQYMAPEQISRQWRQQGPWTDLYAVGCLTHRLLAGAPPFQRDGLTAILRAQLLEPPPPLPDDLQAPDELQRWLDRMLHKSPAGRYQRAADAAWELLRIAERHPRPEPTPASSRARSRRHVDERQVHSETLTLPSLEDLTPQRSTASPAPPTESGPLPPLPDDWRRPEPAVSAQLRGAGVSLFGLRPVPFVGRHQERDRLWAALHAVHRERHPRAVVLDGLPGLGKTRLAEWLGERAHEVGAAFILRVGHAPVPGPASGLGRMLALTFRCVDADRDVTLACVRDLLIELNPDCDEFEWLAITELIHPTPDTTTSPDDTLSNRSETPRRVRFSSRSERHAVIQRLLQLISRTRPVILLIDDAQWGADATALAVQLLQSPTPLPVLLVLTTQSRRGPPLRSGESSLIDALLAQPAAERLDVGPLPDERMRELVHGLLDLDPLLTRQLIERVEGSPLFAIQIVGDWIERDVLRPSERGFVLQAGATDLVPDDIHATLSAQVDRLVTQLAVAGVRHGRRSLELAAALGPAFPLAEWRDACALDGQPLSSRLVEAALDRQLLRQDGGAMAFAHGMMRECLERTAREAGRWESTHATCAAMLAQRHPEHPPIQRIARHLFAARLYERALPLLLDAVRVCRNASDFETAYLLLDLRDRAIRALEPANAAWERAATLIARARTRLLHGYLDTALEHIEHFRRQQDGQRWPAFDAEVAWLEGVAEQKRSRLDVAFERYDAARRGYQALDDPIGLANALYGIGAIHRLRGELDAGQRQTEAALDLFSRHREHIGLGQALSALADIARRQGDAERALDLIHRAVQTFRKAGNRFGIANSLNTLGDFARHRGDLDTAEDSYRESIRMFESVGSTNSPVVRLNLCYILLLRARFDDARAIFTYVCDELERTGWQLFVVYAHVGLLCCAAALDDFDAWHHHYRCAMDRLETSHVVDDDLAWTFHLAADLARNAGQHRLALDAYGQALRQWQAAERAHEAQEVRNAMHALLRQPLA